MDSLSRPFPSTKLSNVPPYDAVFSPHRRNPSPIDYQEIFTTSQSSSIPVLDLSTFRDSSHSLTFDFHRSNPDYSMIFGGFSDEVVAVSYQQLFGCDKGRVPSSTPISQDSNNLSHQSPDALKQFNMSYNRITQKSKDGLDGAKHVTQSPAVTGFTRFIDETVMEVEKPKQLAVNVSVDFPGKNSSRNAVRKENNPVESVSEDKKSKVYDVGLRNDQKRSINSEPCRADFGDEIDVNSAASAALKKAIQKAQESIRIAKESVGRKKKGLQSFSSKKIKNRLKVEGGMEDVTTASFMDNEKLFDAKKFINEIHEKITESVKDSKFGDNTAVYNAAEVSSKTGKDECATLCSEYEAGIELRKSTIDSLEHQSVVKELESEENNNEVSQDFNQNDDELLESEKQEHEDSEKHEEIEERVKSENESEHDQNSEIHKDKETCDNKLEESNETCDDKFEESEANLHDDCEIKQEDNPTVEIKVESLEESREQEFDEKSSGDDNVMEETDDIDFVDDASNIVEMNDINVETIHDVDDAIDQTASDDNKDHEVNSEENNIIREEGNIQPPRMEVPDTESTNEVKDSQESESRQKEDEIEEPGPSKVSGKDRFIRLPK